MIDKVLKREDSPLFLGIGVFTGFLTTWVTLWIFQLLIPAGEMHAMSAGIVLCIIIVVGQCLLLRFPYIGVEVALAPALGYALAFGVVFGLAIPEVLIAWLAFALVEYATGFARIARLKRSGYVEEIFSEKSE